MDDERFDALSRRLGTVVPSRRAVLAALLGAALWGHAPHAAADARGHGSPKAKPARARKRDRRREHRRERDQEPATAQAKQCRGQGHPCDGNQTCCAPFVCVVSGPGQAERCTPCPDGTVFFDGACCTPTTCSAEGAACGQISDGCGGTLECGQCTGHDTCGGGGEPHVCGCTPEPDTTTCAGKCGLVTNTCGQTVNCTALCADCCDGGICWPRCNGVCVDRLTDHDNCGDCGVTCGNLVCYHGNCCTAEPDPDFPDQPDICVCAETGWACDGTPGTCCQLGECTAGVCPGPDSRHRDRGDTRVRRHRGNARAA